MSKVFVVNANENLVINCESRDLGRKGFEHVAVMLRNGKTIDSATASYQNRTWEAFPFQTVIRKLIRETEWLTSTEKELYMVKFQ